MDLNDITRNTIFLTQVGSQAYGTNTPESDEDIGGVCIPSNIYRFGIKNFEQANKWVDEKGEKVDKTIYNLTKAINLMLDNNPNMLDYLFVAERSIKVATPEWVRFLEVANQFISSKCRYTYTGYAHAQLERIKTHLKYIENPITKPNRSDYGLPDTTIFPETHYESIAKISTDFIAPEKKNEFVSEAIHMFDTELPLLMRKYVDEDIMHVLIDEVKKSQETYLGTLASISGKFLKEEYLDMAKRELRYISAYKDWKRYNAWFEGRNEKRKQLELKCGYDSKHAMHLIRLSKMAVEILSGKGVNVDRTHIDREELMDIRNGNWKLADIVSYSEKLMREADELYKTTTIPRSPNRELIEGILVDVLQRYQDK